MKHIIHGSEEGPHIKYIITRESINLLTALYQPWMILWFRNSVSSCVLSRVKQITSPGWMHETSARAWCSGKTRGVG